MTRSIAVNCEARLKVENSIPFHCHPQRSQVLLLGDGGETDPSRLFSHHPESCSEAAYRCNPSTAAWAVGPAGCEPKPISISLSPSPNLSRPQCVRRPPHSVSPSLRPGTVCKGSCQPSGTSQTWIGEGVGRDRGFPSNLRQAWLRESFSKFPAAPAQVASAGRADGGKHASLAAAASATTAASSALWAARLLAGSGPGSRRAGPPPGAKAAADAGGLEGGSCPAPTAQAAPRRLHLGPPPAGTGARPEESEGARGHLHGPARP